MISREPEGLASVVGGDSVWQWFDDWHDDSRFSNHVEIDDLLSDCYFAFKDHHFPLLIELCGTSDPLEALSAAHSEDDLSLHVLCHRESWNTVLARIKQLHTKATVAELVTQDERGHTAFVLASRLGAPADPHAQPGLDTKKRNILAIANIDLQLPLHYAAERHTDPAASKLLVRHRPQALLAKDSYGFTPLDYAIECNESPAVVSLMRNLTAARCATIALRTTLLLCIKHGYV